MADIFAIMTGDWFTGTLSYSVLSKLRTLSRSFSNGLLSDVHVYTWARSSKIYITIWGISWQHTLLNKFKELCKNAHKDVDNGSTTLQLMIPDDAEFHRIMRRLYPNGYNLIIGKKNKGLHRCDCPLIPTPNSPLL